MRSGSASCSSAKAPCASRNASKAGPRAPSCATWPRSRRNPQDLREDVDYRTPRGLDRAVFLKLAGCDWIRERRHCLLTGPAGVGKSWLACALGYKACRENLSVLYQRVPRLFAALALARGDGRYAKLLKQLARVDLLILDDWGPKPLLPEQQRDLLEIVEDRYDAGSLIITSQVPIDHWYEIVGNPTLADAILDRILHNAHRIELRGESLRKRRVAG
jgi:DNA replication protein DnaC